MVQACCVSPPFRESLVCSKEEKDASSQNHLQKDVISVVPLKEGLNVCVLYSYVGGIVLLFKG